jgi:activator of Hsp90 ATPase protein 1
MPKTLQQTVRFAAPPARVYALYADPRLHRLATGAPAKFVAKPGADFSAWDGHLRGRLLVLDAPRLIVQTWRGADWKASDADSVLVLTFRKDGRGTVLTMVHSNVPDAHAASIRAGWPSHYWTLWRTYLRSRAQAN